MDGTLTTLLSSGIDAFTNLWDITLTLPPQISSKLAVGSGVGNGTGAYSVRAVGFTPPELTVTTYTVDYKAIQLTRPNTKFEGDRTFTIEFRLDAAYNLYYDLMSWKHIWFDPSGEANINFGGLAGASVTGDQNNYGAVSVYGYNSSTNTLSAFSDTSSTTGAVAWSFFDVICMKVGTPSFQRQNSDALTTTATFLFGRMIEPGSSVQNLSSLATPPNTTPPTLGHT
jgi:hypothetical protein